MSHKEAVIDFNLYLITDRTKTKGRDILGVVGSALSGGVRCIQLREKDLSGRELFELATKLRFLTNRFGARLIINDRIDIAQIVGACGVHLPSNGITPRDARKLLGKDALIGVSTHSTTEAKIAEKEGADFVTTGPVFDTPSKAIYGAPIGLETLSKITSEITIPVLALGGVKKNNVEATQDAGAFGIALISGIISATEVEQETKEFLKLL
ncbi:MAG: thiamine phosphate synthase [Deltaproteobacteria bacterium]|nr:thiamine phosphate synthase [Deltaproteobacteria bacterium]